MRIWEIAERHATQFNGPSTALTFAIERAIREAAAPLVEALGRTVGRNVQDELSRKAALAEWRSKP